MMVRDTIRTAAGTGGGRGKGHGDEEDPACGDRHRRCAGRPGLDDAGPGLHRGQLHERCDRVGGYRPGGRAGWPAAHRCRAADPPPRALITIRYKNTAELLRNAKPLLYWIRLKWQVS